MAFFRAQPYAWRRPATDEISRMKLQQSSLWGDLFRSLGDVGGTYFLDKERREAEAAELARAEEKERRRREESDRGYELDLAESLTRMGAVPRGHRIARAIQEDVPLALPVSPFGSTVATDVPMYQDATIEDLYERGLPVPTEVPGFGRVEIPPEMIQRFKLGEQEYYSQPSPRDVAALLREGRLSKAETRRMEAETDAIKNRDLLATRMYDAALAAGAKPEQAQALADAVRMDEAPAGAISGALRPPRASSTSTSGQVTPKDRFNAQKQWLANVEREVDRRLGEAQKAAKDSPYKKDPKTGRLVTDPQTGRLVPNTVPNRDEVRRQIEQENTWEVGSIGAARAELLGGRPFPAHLFPGVDFGAAGTTGPALESWEVDEIVGVVEANHLDQIQARDLMREMGYDDAEISQALNEMADRGLGSRMGPGGR